MQWRKERVESLGSAQSLDWSDSPHRVSRLHSNSSASRSFPPGPNMHSCSGQLSSVSDVRHPVSHL